MERSAGCACAKAPVIERKPYKTYDFGEENCSKVKGDSRDCHALVERNGLAKQVLTHLQSLSEAEKSEELKRGQFLNASLKIRPMLRRADPCLGGRLSYR